MGGVCAKNDAGKAASDVPNKPLVKRGDKMLESTQKPLTAKDEETKWIASEDNFNVDKGIELKADDKAAEVATAWAAQHPEWEYTGQWKNEQNVELNKEVSSFEVRKISSAEAAVVPIVMEESKMEDQKRPAEVLDQKQSFVDQVSEGLVKKVSSDRFKTDEEEEKKNEATTAAATVEQTKEGSLVKEQESPAKKDDAAEDQAENGAADVKDSDNADAPVEEEQKDAADATGPTEAEKVESDKAASDKPEQEETKEEPVQEPTSEDVAKADDAPDAQATNDVKTDEKESDVAEGLGADDQE